MSSSSSNLAYIVDRLNEAPFSKAVSVIQLHDDWSFFQLLGLLNEVIVYIDNTGNSLSSFGNSFVSRHKVDLRDETAETTTQRLLEALSLLKYKTNFDELAGHLLEGKKQAVFDALFYLLQNIEVCAKRAYLAPFLSAPNVPPEILMDQDLSKLAQQLTQLQANFVQTHRYFEELKVANQPTIELKKDIHKMEEDKQQVLLKIGRLKKRIEQIPNNEVWLEAARNLRISKKTMSDQSNRYEEQVRLIQENDSKITILSEKVNTLRVQNKGLTINSALNRISEEVNTSNYLVQEKYPKSLAVKRLHVNVFQGLVSSGPISGDALKQLEKEIMVLQEELSQLPSPEKDILSQNPLDDRITLFRQQAKILTNKKETKANELLAVTQKHQELSQSYNREKTLHDTTRLMNAEEFKKFVSDLRNKSSDYKTKKNDLSYLQREIRVLQKTEETIGAKSLHLQQQKISAEKSFDAHGVGAKQQIWDPSQSWDRQVESVRDLIEQGERVKISLSEANGALAQVRERKQDLSIQHADKKKKYDAAIFHVEQDTLPLANEIKGYRDEIRKHSSTLFELDILKRHQDILNLKVQNEMKAYIGSTETDDFLRSKGSKSYRDYYLKKLHELEMQTKNYSERLQDVNDSFSKKSQERELMTQLKALFEIKAQAIFQAQNETDISGIQETNVGEQMIL